MRTSIFVSLVGLQGCEIKWYLASDKWDTSRSMVCTRLQGSFSGTRRKERSFEGHSFIIFPLSSHLCHP